MQGDMSTNQEKAVLALLAKATSITDLTTLLNVVVQELPDVVGALGCWIYLHPDYVPEYSGFVIRGEKEIGDTDLVQVFDEFIVLAATNLESKKKLVGKAYFGAGEGFTGWAYRNGRPLRILDVSDDQELKEYFIESFIGQMNTTMAMNCMSLVIRYPLGCSTYS